MSGIRSRIPDSQERIIHYENWSLALFVGNVFVSVGEAFVDIAPGDRNVLGCLSLLALAASGLYAAEAHSIERHIEN